MPLLGLYIHYLENCGNLTQDPALHALCVWVEKTLSFRFFFWSNKSEAKKKSAAFILCDSRETCSAQYELRSNSLERYQDQLIKLSANTHLWVNTYTNTHAQSARWCPPPPPPTHAHTVPLKCGPGSKFLGSFMLIPISISGVNKPLQLRLMRLYHGEGSSEVGWGSWGWMTQTPSYWGVQ